ncbi:unnamed protein product [Schistosoma margrebowiei]|uniref:Uncharacterized protein n=1 Tax=Schistosoma margrebowiei TaxID=48269 RepID=A0A183N428_9TREM|nr:unnamed protein product [Schistosoma margrebowiei]
MNFTRSHHTKPNRLYLHQQNNQEDYRGRENQERSRDEIETQEALDNGADNITKVQYVHSSGNCQIQQIQDSTPQQIPGLS